jgi:hypothetical protein
MFYFLFGALLASQHPPQNNIALFCLACGSAAVLFLLFILAVVVCNRLGHKWAEGFYPNIFLPDWEKKDK